MIVQNSNNKDIDFQSTLLVFRNKNESYFLGKKIKVLNKTFLSFMIFHWIIDHNVFLLFMSLKDKT